MLSHITHSLQQVDSNSQREEALHNHSRLQQHQQESSPSATESISPLFDETQNYSSPCKVTSSQHAKCCWGENERRERQIAERMREDKYSTHRRPSGGWEACTAWSLTESQLRRLTSETVKKKEKTLGGGVEASTEERFSDLTYDGSQPENVRQTTVHRFIRRILQEIITCEEDRQMLDR